MRVDAHRVCGHLHESLLTWGKVRVVGSTILTAGRSCDLTVQVELRQAIAAGFSIEVWTHFVSDIARPQADDPRQPAWFTCVGDGRPVVSQVYVKAAVHGPDSFFPYRRYAAAKLPEGAKPGDIFLFQFRDVIMQTYEEELFNLRFAIVDSASATVVGYLGDTFYHVVGSAPAALRLVAPTCVQVGEPFRCHVIVCDSYGNKTGEPTASFSYGIETEAGPAPIAPGHVVYDGQWQRHTITGLSCPAEGVYYLRACLRHKGQEIVGVSNPIVARRTWQNRVVWGDLHQHAYLDDGRGTPAANYAYALATACLDFCSVTPHEECVFAPAMHRLPAPPQSGWAELTEATERFNGKDFVTILGSEPGGLFNYLGHTNVYYLQPPDRPVTERLSATWWQTPSGKLQIESYQRFLDELAHTNGEYLLLPHAHAGGGPGVYDLPVLPQFQTNVEICSVHGVFEEFYAQWLMHGHFVGVHGGGDNHMTSTGQAIPGYHYPNTNGLTGAWMPEMNRRAVWEAYRGRTTYAVTGNQRVFLDLRVDDEPMGSVLVGCKFPRRLHVETAGTAPVLRIDILRNGAVAYTYRSPTVAHNVLRLMWTDDWVSRRVDDSHTTGTVVPHGARLSLIAALNAFHPTDSFAERNGAVVFRSNAYSGIRRGVLAAVHGDCRELRFEIHDVRLEKPVLDAAFGVPLKGDHVCISCPMDTEDVVRFGFVTPPRHPQFCLEADWVDLSWPRTVCCDWRDDDASPAYYTVRVEQVDGNIAWSSPIWCLDAAPQGGVPGRVVVATEHKET